MRIALYDFAFWGRASICASIYIMLAFIAIILRALRNYHGIFTDLTEIWFVGRSIVNRGSFNQSR